MKSKEKAIGITGKKLVYEGKTILKIRDSYMNGEGVLKIGGLLNMTETDEKIDQGQNLAMWGEAVFMPWVIIMDARARWEAVDDETARLVMKEGRRI